METRVLYVKEEDNLSGEFTLYYQGHKHISEIVGLRELFSFTWKWLKNTANLSLI